jgi:hypothetical protein
MLIKLNRIGKIQEAQSGAKEALYRFIKFRWPFRKPWVFYSFLSFINQSEKQKDIKWHSIWDCKTLGIHQVRTEDYDWNKKQFIKVEPYCFHVSEEGF